MVALLDAEALQTGGDGDDPGAQLGVGPAAAVFEHDIRLVGALGCPIVDQVACDADTTIGDAGIAMSSIAMSSVAKSCGVSHRPQTPA